MKMKYKGDGYKTGHKGDGMKGPYYGKDKLNSPPPRPASEGPNIEMHGGTTTESSMTPGIKSRGAS